MGHTVEFTEAACSEKGFDALILAIKLLSLTALELYQNVDLLEEIKGSRGKI